MAAGGAFGGSRGLKPVPPEKGVFPLDHFHECRSVMQEYMACLRQNNSKADKCRHISKKYLECRMDKNLMCKQDLKELGFVEKTELVETSPSSKEEPVDDRARRGYIAGLSREQQPR